MESCHFTTRQTQQTILFINHAQVSKFLL